jgi:coenzyme F420 hydrogenase subunit beta
LADVSFGGIGADEGWTTFITRTPVGRAIVADARSQQAVEDSHPDARQKMPSQTLKKVNVWSSKKRKAAFKNRRTLGNKYPGAKQEG